MWKYIIFLFFILACQVDRHDYVKADWEYDKTGTLYIQWADGKTEVYKGKFRDFPDRVILLNASIIKTDTVKSDTLMYYGDQQFDEDNYVYTFLDSVNGYYYIRKEYIYCLRQELIKAQMKRCTIE